MTPLPTGWATAPVGAVLEIQYGKGLPRRDRDPAGEVPVYGSAGVVGRHSAALVDGPVLIIGRKGNVGATYLSPVPCWPIDTAYFASVPDGVDPAFLSYQLQSLGMKELDSSTAIPSLRRETLEAQLLTLAPGPEQARIVAAIEEQLSRIDSGVGLLNAVAKKLHHLRRALVREIASGDWPVVRVGDVATVAGGHTPKGFVGSGDGVIPFYKVGDMNASNGREMARSRTYVDEAAVASYRLRLWPAGTVVFPKQGGAIATNKKRILTRPAACDLNTMGVVPSDGIIPDYLWLAFEAVDLGSLSDGSVVAQIKPKRVADLRIALPPRAAQARIVVEAEIRLCAMDSLLEHVTKAVSRAKVLRHAVMNRAFEGGLVPQDPADQPATALLAAITDGRASSIERAGRGERRRPSSRRSARVTGVPLTSTDGPT